MAKDEENLRVMFFFLSAVIGQTCFGFFFVGLAILTISL